MLKIEKGIPMPDQWQENHGRTKDDEIRKTIFAMEVKDSVSFVDYREATRFRSRAQSIKKSLRGFDKEFALRTQIDENGNTFWRVWRSA